jgi:hypothetical protein
MDEKIAIIYAAETHVAGARFSIVAGFRHLFREKLCGVTLKNFNADNNLGVVPPLS